MKKIIVIISVILVLLIAAIIVIPIAFKGPLMEKVKTTINKNVNAKVEFSDFNLNLWRNFPKVRAEIVGLSITGINQFENDTLLAAASIATTLSLSDLIKGEDLKISSLQVSKANIRLLSTIDGLTNWDIAISDDAGEEDEESTGDEMAVSLQNIEIRDLNLTYHDEASNTLLRLLHSDMDASGGLEGTVTRLKLDAEIGELVLEYDSVQYIANTVLKIKSQLTADYDKMNFEFGESTLYLNELPLDISGRFEMPSDSMYFDLQFKQPQSKFETLLAMVPESYQSYLKDITTTGEAGLEGQVKGWFYEENYPEINSRIYIKDASLQYAGLPEKVEHISLESQISKPQGEMDLLMINVSEASARLRENPVNMKLSLTHPMSDPAFDASFDGKINFSHLADAFPMDSIEIKGFMDGKLMLKGTMSAVEKKDFKQISSSGAINFRDFLIKTPQITRPVEISSGAVNINNTDITFSSFAAKTGQSNFQLNGNLSNYLPYFLLDETLKGEFKLSSDFLNFNELASLMAEDTTTVAPSEGVVAFQVPDKLDLVFRSHIDRAVFDQMDIRNIDGTVQVKNKKLELQNLTMDMLQGQMTIDGTYQSNTVNKPTFDFNMTIKSFQIPAAYQSFSMMQQYMPIAARSQGSISSQINFKGQFDEKLDIIPSSLNGKGFFNTQNLRIVDSQTFDKIKNFIKKEKLKNVSVDDFTAHIKMENGNVQMDPFQTKIADQEVTVGGTLSVESILNMALDFKVNKEDLGDDIAKGLGFLPGTENIKLLDVSVLIKGELKKPEVSLDLSNARRQIEEEVKKSTKKELEKSVKKIGNELKKLFN